MVLLMERVYPDTICLVRRWRSNTMLRYLHTMSNSFTKDLSAKIFKHVAYMLLPPAHAGN